MKKGKMGRGLVQGDTIGIVAPSAPSLEQSPQAALDYLKDLGYNVVLGESAKASWGYLAGKDEVRAADINSFFANPDIDAILCLRGGYGATRLLDLLDYEIIAAHPKLFMGYSDITALHIVFQQRCGLATVHCPMTMTLSRKPTAYTKAQFAKGLVTPITAGDFPLPRSHNLVGLVKGSASGTLIGGNMSLVTALIGTPYELDGTNSLLFLEEVGEEAYSLDRMLRQMEQSGLIDRVSGILFGEFSKCVPVKKQKGEFTVEEIIRQYALRWQKPALMGIPAGHGRQNAWLPLGVPAGITIKSSKQAIFTIN